MSLGVDCLYDIWKKKLRDICASLKTYAITVDFWTARKTGMYLLFIHQLFLSDSLFPGISFCGLSLHYVDDQFMLRMFYLGCKPYTLDNQKAPSVRMFVEHELAIYGLSLGYHSYVVSDNENKMKAAFGDVTRVGCADHYLSKRLQHAFIDTKADTTEA